MKSFLLDVFQYHFIYNEKLLLEIEEAMDRLPDRSYPLYCHILNAHQIWNARISGGQAFGVRDIYNFEKAKSVNVKNWSDSKTIIQETDLNSDLHYQNSKGENFVNSIRDILFHIANHTTHHRGQIISDFRASGLEPIMTDYIFYKR